MEIDGRFGRAVVHTDNIDPVTVKQVKSLLDSPCAEDSSVHIMPDCHAGAGCVIGTTMTLTEKVVPNLVGVDIGCGVLVMEMGDVEFDPKRFDECVHRIPSGLGMYRPGNEREYRTSGIRQWEASDMSVKDPAEWMAGLTASDRLVRQERVYNSLGTLGGGNHFIEVDVDSEGRRYLVVHSGSRDVGAQVANVYQDVAVEECRRNGVDVERDLSYLEGQSLEDYFHDMRMCQEYARENRRAMARQIMEHYLGEEFKVSADRIGRFPLFESVHNYINFDDRILRKGAISAHTGQRLIIPMNMRDGSLICTGRGNEDWNLSAPHGAGRVSSRKDARERISMEEYRRSMEGIYSTCVSKNTVDEAPMAYKPMEEIIRNIDGMNVDVDKIIKPVYNFKAAI